MRMSYSRRELYALGEPLGDSATFRKADGGLVLGDGGGGGSAPAPADTTQVQTQELPEWAKGYAKDVLAKGQALTDLNQNPYQTYGGQRQADFSGLQSQSFQNAQNIGPNALTAQGGIDSLNAGRNYQNMATDPNAVGAYMSPYMDQVVNNQMSAANRNYDISAANQKAQATQAGAFGGSRDAVMRAENERARNSALQGIQAQGLQSAFQNAQQAQQFGSTLGLQGAQAAEKAGQDLYGQAVGATTLQNQLGAQQQAQAQKGLDTEYQEFINRQNQPYKQLSYMSDLIRGQPLGMQSTNQVYQAPPSAVQNITGLGLGAAGIASLMKADGGVIRGYADGGSVNTYAGDKGSVTSSDNVQEIVHDIKSDQELQTALKAAAARRDMEAVQAIQQEMSFRASMRNGLAGTITPDMAQRMAGGGGVLAFAGDDEENDPITGQMVSSPGDPRAFSNFNQELLRSMQSIRDFKPVGMTEKEYNDAISGRYALLSKMSGPDPYAGQMDQIAALDKDRESSKNIGQAAALFRGARAAVQGGNAMRGLAGAGAEVGEGFARAAQADAAEKRAAASMKFNLLDAQRKERQGLTRDSIAAADQARKDKTDLNSAHIAKQKALGTLAAQGARIAKPTGGAGGPGSKEWNYATATYLPLAKKKYPNATPEEQNAYAYQMYQNNKSAGLPGATEKTNASLLIAGAKDWGNKNSLEQKKWAKSKGYDVEKPGWEAQAEQDYVESYKSPVIEVKAKGGTIGPIKLD